MSLTRQAGFLTQVAVFLILVMAFIGVAVSYMANSALTSTVSFIQADQALIIADGGMEKASRYLLTPTLTGTPKRSTCAALTANANLTASALGTGTFTVTAVSGAHYLANNTLSAALTAAATTLSLTAVTGLAPRGRVTIDNEIIDYQAISGTTLTGLIRGASTSLASSHTSGTYVAQYQCLVNVLSGVPNITNPTGLQEQQRAIQLQDIWAVGNSTGNNYTFSRWNNPTELAWTATAVTDATHKNNLLSISMLSNAEGWAVGTITGTVFNIVHFLNGTWAWTTSPAATCNTQTLNAVHAVSSQEAWAVGNSYLSITCTSGTATFTILRWNGTAWSALTTATTPGLGTVPAGQNLNDVKVLDTNGDGLGDFGFAVGNAGVILQYNGSKWSTVTSPTTAVLNGVFLTSASEAWAVGAGGVILHWTSAANAWSTFASPTTTTLTSIKMIDTNGNGTADVGFAVGGTVGIQYNGSSWAHNNPGVGTLLDATVYTATDIWVVGATGQVTHYDGTGWTAFSSGTTLQLNAASKIYPKSVFRSNFTQIQP